jgi:hypothetical protein
MVMLAAGGANNVLVTWVWTMAIVGAAALAGCGGGEVSPAGDETTSSAGGEGDATFTWHEARGCGSTLEDDVACERRGDASCEMEVPRICVGAESAFHEARERQDAEQRARTLRCACTCDADRAPCRAP